MNENECLYNGRILEVERESFTPLTFTIHGSRIFVLRLSNLVNHWQAKDFYRNQW